MIDIVRSIEEASSSRLAAKAIVGIAKAADCLGKADSAIAGGGL